MIPLGEVTSLSLSLHLQRSKGLPSLFEVEGAFVFFLTFVCPCRAASSWDSEAIRMWVDPVRSLPSLTGHGLADSMLYRSAFTKGSRLLIKIDSSVVTRQSPNFLRVRCSVFRALIRPTHGRAQTTRGGKAGLQRPILRNPASTGPVSSWATRAAEGLALVLAGQMGRNSRGFRTLGLRSFSFSSPSCGSENRSQSRLTRPAAESASTHPLRPSAARRREPAAVSSPSPARWPR